MLLDANLLLYAVDRSADRHQAAASGLTDVLNGTTRVGIPWQTIGAFVRIATHRRVTERPSSGPQAWTVVEGWLAADPAWIPPATERTAAVYGQLVGTVPVTGNLVPDAMLAALAVEHGLTVMTVDTDFARFSSVRWENPLL
ncbi:MAG: TA system VapC family ribonuclease toxin [Acidimicrobiia bacterium]